MEDVGVYVHVPFCERVCPYCDFAVVATPELPTAREERYVEALLAELAARQAVYAGRPLASLYLGGGTPSLLRPESVGRIIAAVREAFPAAGEPEITLEVNPGTLERARLAGFAAAGVRRVSVGVQSFQDRTLQRLGRAHRAEECRATLRAAREAGFDAVSLDLIVAAPGQDRDALRADLDEALAFAPEHLSTYELTIEPGTPFALADRREQLDRPDEDTVLAMLEEIESRLSGAGLARYEISSYARPGFEAVHNRRYWQRRPVLGLGVGAVSNDPPGPGAPHGTRRRNPRALEDWEAGLHGGAGGPAAEVEVLTPPMARGETMFLGLRAREGVDAAAFAREFGAPPRGFWPDAIDALCARGLLEERADGSLRLSAAGRRLADTVFENFV